MDPARSVGLDDAGLLAIRPLAGESEIALLEQHLPSTMPEKHRFRFACQGAGRAVYLIAWLGDAPVGHLFLKWYGSDTARVARLFPDCPEIEDYLVAAGYRGHGIGLQLIVDAERRARERGYRRIGLAAGMTPEYDRARRIYARRNYRSAGIAPFNVGWWLDDVAGARLWWEEAAEYLVKEFAGEDSDG